VCFLRLPASVSRGSGTATSPGEETVAKQMLPSPSRQPAMLCCAAGGAISDLAAITGDSPCAECGAVALPRGQRVPAGCRHRRSCNRHGELLPSPCALCLPQFQQPACCCHLHILLGVYAFMNLHLAFNQVTAPVSLKCRCGCCSEAYLPLCSPMTPSAVRADLRQHASCSLQLVVSGVSGNMRSHMACVSRRQHDDFGHAAESPWCFSNWVQDAVLHDPCS
jgi:hypothetical protein